MQEEKSGVPFERFCAFFLGNIQEYSLVKNHLEIFTHLFIPALRIGSWQFWAVHNSVI